MQSNPRDWTSQRVRVIDAHTGGPTRLVVSGDPDLGNGPLAARLEGFREEPGTLDHLVSNRFDFCAVRLTAHGHEEAPAAGFAVRSVVFETDIAAFRLAFNWFPTGVEVCQAMVQGGPYPSTSDGRSTSVSSNEIFRFTRLVCYQGFPDSAPARRR